VNEILITVSKTDVQSAVKQIESLQKKADSVTEESLPYELRKAYHDHGEAEGCIHSLRDLKLLPEPDYSRLLLKQMRIAEKIAALQEERLTSTANTGEPQK